ncbi:Uncharacterised protein [Enterobacter hormaechei]|nr:Uncharacterised protein [Enterobacter hormaechei]
MFSRLVQDRFVPVQALTLIAPGRQNKLHIAINRAVAAPAVCRNGDHRTFRGDNADFLTRLVPGHLQLAFKDHDHLNIRAEMATDNVVVSKTQPFDGKTVRAQDSGSGIPIL